MDVCDGERARAPDEHARVPMDRLSTPSQVLPVVYKSDDERSQEY